MNSDRTERIRVALERAETALRLSSEPVWAELWNSIEQELLGRLLDLTATDDDARWRLSQAIDVARRVRNLVEQQGAMKDQLSKELDLLEGRVLAARA